MSVLNPEWRYIPAVATNIGKRHWPNLEQQNRQRRMQKNLIQRQKTKSQHD